MRTFPCIKGKIGDWTFYNTCIRMSELVNCVKFADEIFPRTDLDQVMQRELTERSLQITKYLLNNDQRFMGSLIIAAVGGQPKFTPLSFGESAYNFAEGRLGFLNFDGSENYYALDGQHRLAAIKAALQQDPLRLSTDEVALIIIWHESNQEGRTRARRLFTTVNRYAKKTSKADDLAFDEDNPVDIYTRRLIREHPFFRKRTKVTKLAKQGEFKLTKSEALRSEDDYDKSFLFSVITLRRCNELLLKKWVEAQDIQPQVLPEFEILEQGYELLLSRWDTLLQNVNPWTILAQSDVNLDGYRMKHGGHPLVRPIAIVAFIEAAADTLETPGAARVLEKVSQHFRDITAPPFRGLLWKEAGGMHDGQARRKAVASLYSYYLNNSPTIADVKRQIEGTIGLPVTADFPERETVLS